MQLHNVVRIPDSLQGTWAELVEQARADIGSLVDLFVEYVGQVDGYRDGIVPMKWVRVDSLSSLEYLLGQISGNDEFKADVIWTARRLGSDRARIGIPLNTAQYRGSGGAPRLQCLVGSLPFQCQSR
jgi:hypothetical protein